MVTIFSSVWLIVKGKIKKMETFYFIIFYWLRSKVASYHQSHFAVLLRHLTVLHNVEINFKIENMKRDQNFDQVVC